jgi:hypothetical protein
MAKSKTLSVNHFSISLPRCLFHGYTLNPVIGSFLQYVCPGAAFRAIIPTHMPEMGEVDFQVFIKKRN